MKHAVVTGGSGFLGSHLSKRLLSEGYKVTVLDNFITGSRDPVRAFMPHEAMTGHVTDLRDVVIIEGAGHWVQQECPDEVNASLLAFLDELDATA